MSDNQSGVLVEHTNSASTYVVTAIIAFAIGFGSAWVIYSKNSTDKTANNLEVSKTDELTDGTTTDVKLDDSSVISGAKIQLAPTNEASTTKSVSVGTDASIVVTNQNAGSEVKIDKVVLTKPSWVAIVDVYEDGSTGYILGAKLFDAGTNSGIVELLRGTVSGKTYGAVIREDNGDESFVPKSDLPLKNSKGEIVLTKFKAN